MKRLVMLACAFALAGAGSASAQRNSYQQGILLDIATGAHVDQTSYLQMPAIPSIGYPGASVPITVKGDYYDVVIRIGDIVYRARTAFNQLPTDLVINDALQVRFATEKKTEWMYILRPNAEKYRGKDKEYKTSILSRVRVSEAPTSAAAPPSNAPGPSPAAPPPPAPAAAASAPTSAPSALPDATAVRDACVQKREGASCTLLGEMYFKGVNVPKDELRSASFLKQGCDAGHARGCAELALLYGTGDGITKDPAKAFELATRACDANDLLGCALLGSAYADGSGVEKDSLRAAILYKQACDGDVVLACVELGTMYDEGIGLPRDYTGAAMLYRQGCDGGAMNGCDSLGRLYELGHGVPSSTDRALELYQQACKGGESPACPHVDALRNKLAGKQPQR